MYVCQNLRLSIAQCSVTNAIGTIIVAVRNYLLDLFLASWFSDHSNRATAARDLTKTGNNLVCEISGFRKSIFNYVQDSVFDVNGHLIDNINNFRCSILMTNDVTLND